MKNILLLFILLFVYGHYKANSDVSIVINQYGRYGQVEQECYSPEVYLDFCSPRSERRFRRYRRSDYDRPYNGIDRRESFVENLEYEDVEEWLKDNRDRILTRYNEQEVREILERNLGENFTEEEMSQLIDLLQ